MRGLTVKNLKNTIHYHVVIIGTGANGSHIFRSMLQDMATYAKANRNISFDITIADEDKVERKNCAPGMRKSVA
ncbi:hypothetical protein [Peribacillus asahii]|uniref:hypothetical protein n=1 Tax=Peribacillus asahii TaxID=228899 RepID=UPI00207AC508|nr:hypothetical protein [Peribacillus asahii]USK62232.1 hypothetical protein LIT37_23960 [Peribacillus asahii]